MEKLVGKIVRRILKYGYHIIVTKSIAGNFISFHIVNDKDEIQAEVNRYYDDDDEPIIHIYKDFWDAVSSFSGVEEKPLKNILAVVIPNIIYSSVKYDLPYVNHKVHSTIKKTPTLFVNKFDIFDIK